MAGVHESMLFRGSCLVFGLRPVVTRPLIVLASLAVLAPSLLVSPASAAVDSDVFTWGSNSFGQLGDGSSLSTMRGTPGAVAVNSVIEVSGGREHVIALKDDGSVITWGSDANGALGNGTPLSSSSTPVSVAGLTDVIDVDDGHYHSLALKANGTVWGWGQNSLGQLAQGNETSPKTSPVQWGSISDAVGIFGGRDMTYVLDADGALWCSGGFGLECGRTAQGNEITTPVPVNGLPDLVEVAGGRNHAVALATDGTVWTFGENVNGQLGDNSRQNRFTPEQVAGLSDVVDVGAGADHSMAVTASGQLYTWGENGRGELGLGNTTDRLLPVLVPGLSDIVDSDAGRSHSFAVGGDGRLWAWGWNEGRQVNASGSNVLSPYEVPGVSDVVVAGGGQAYSVALTEPVAAVLSDGFDAGLANWTVTGKLQVDDTRAAPGGQLPSVRAALKTPRRAGAVRSLPAEQTSGCYSGWIRPVSTSTATTLLRLRATGGSGIAQVQLLPSGELRVVSELGGGTVDTGVNLAFSQWRQVSLCSRHEVGDADAVRLEVGGVEVDTWAWPTSPIGQIQIGSLKKTMAVYNLDDVAVTSSFI